jgi:hypothetical protein
MTTNHNNSTTVLCIKVIREKTQLIPRSGDLGIQHENFITAQNIKTSDQLRMLLIHY